MDIEDSLKKEIANLVSLNDPNAILAAAKTTNNPNEALLLLSKIEEKNIEAKVLAGQINLKSLRSSGQIKLEKSPQDASNDAFSRLKYGSDLGNLQAKESLAYMYAYGYGIEKNLTVAAKLFLEAGGVNSASFFNFCMNYKQVPECNSVVDKQNEYENKRKANELATMNRVTIVASCAGIGKDFIQTVMMAMASDLSSGISAIRAQSDFCRSLSIPLNNETIMMSKVLVGTGRNGAQYYVAPSNDPNIKLGLIKRPN